MLDAQYEGNALHGYTYSREGHPNADVVAQARSTAMEGAPHMGVVVTSSGMGAVSAVLLGLTKAGDHVIGGNQLYGQVAAHDVRGLCPVWALQDLHWSIPAMSR